MSYTEIFKFKKDGNSELVGETKNAFRSAMFVWRFLEKKYLSPYHPAWARVLPSPNPDGYTRTSDLDAIREIWDLGESEKLTAEEKIILLSTFDDVIVMREDIPKIISSFRTFDPLSSLPEQAEIIEDLYNNDPDMIAIAWNQTSVNGQAWKEWDTSNDEGENEDTDDQLIPYNIFTNTKHWNLFDNEQENQSPEETQNI